MAVFSRRFWNSLILHDRRLLVASTDFEHAAQRYRASRHCVTADAQLEFRIELLESLQELRDAIAELRAFQARYALREAE